MWGEANMNLFKMKTDQESQEYLLNIKSEMVNRFAISEEEAIGRINNYFENMEFIGYKLMLYHEDETYWANTIYYGKDSEWWLREGEAIEPTPYP